jgi:hypothetical protein
MNQKMLAIAAVLAAALLAGIFSSPMAAYAGGDDDDDDEHDDEERNHDDNNDDSNDNGDYSGTMTEQELEQENLGSGASTNSNCGQNLIDSFSTLVCAGATIAEDGAGADAQRSHED